MIHNQPGVTHHANIETEGYEARGLYDMVAYIASVLGTWGISDSRLQHMGRSQRTYLFVQWEYKDKGNSCVSWGRDGLEAVVIALDDGQIKQTIRNMGENDSD